MPPFELTLSQALSHRPAPRPAAPPDSTSHSPSIMAPSRKRKRTPPDAVQIEPCHTGRCHFHRLRCGHVVKTPLHLAPTTCATNCEMMPLPPFDGSTHDDGWGDHPFTCPVCMAKALSLLWKMDVVNLKKQLPHLSLAEYAEWVRTNYVSAWEKRRWTRMAKWIPGGRECAQLRMSERAMVKFRDVEAKAPYPIEQYRRIYERRIVDIDFWNEHYRDQADLPADYEAEPGVVYDSVEKVGVHYWYGLLTRIDEEEEI